MKNPNGDQRMVASTGTPDPRAHMHGLPTTALGRAGLALQKGLERIVSRASLHGDSPVYDTALFPWARTLEQSWRAIREELDAVLTRVDEMPAFQSILKEVGTIQSDQDWKTFWLAGMGMDCSRNAARCPRTMEALSAVPDLSTAFFSVLAPGKHIPAHRGAYNGILRLHLALMVPEPHERCRIRIGDEIRTWQEGEALIFDDSYNHEVWNDTPGRRVVLFVDFARPLRQPWHAMNRAFLKIGALAPFLREADQKHRAWEKSFYGPAPKDGPEPRGASRR